MTTTTGMQTQVETLLKSLVRRKPAAVRLSASGRGKSRIFEVYVFTLIAFAANRVPRLRSAVYYLGRPSPGRWQFIVRGAPRKLYDVDSTTGQSYSCVRIENAARSATFTRELHLNVCYRGFSGQLHELDISLIPTGTANTLRRTSRDPTGTSALSAVECKAYGSAAGIEISRQLIGTLDDLNRQPPCPPVNGPKHRRCKGCPHSTISILVSCRGWTPGATGLATAWGLMPASPLPMPATPASATSLVVLTTLEKRFAAEVVSRLLDGNPPYNLTSSALQSLL